MTKIKYSVAIVLVGIMFFIVGCGEKSKIPPEIQKLSEVKDGTILRLGFYGDPWNLNPLLSLSNHGRMMCNLIHAAPLKKTKTGAYAPFLFDSWWLTKGASGTVIMDAVWKTNLKWSDGNSFDPNDLKFTFEQMKKKENASPYAKLANGVLSVNSFGRGKRTRIVFANDSRRYLDLLTVGIIPSHIFGEQRLDAAKLPGKASETPKLYSDFPVGLGSYKIAKREKGYYTLLEPSGQSGLIASAPKILVKSFFNPGKLIEEFRNNRLDWVNLPSEYLASIKQLPLEKSVITKYPNPSYLMWLFNTKKAPFDNTKFRAALDLISNREKIQKLIPYAGQSLYCSPLSANLPGIGDKYSEKVVKAKAMLVEAGLTDKDANGLLEWNGSELVVDICYNKDNLMRKLIAESLIGDLKTVGIKGNLVAVSWSELLSKRLETGNFSSCVISYQLPFYGNWVNFLSTDHSVGENLNFSGFDNAEVTQILTEIDSMISISETKKIIGRQKLAEIMNRECPAVFLFRPFNVGMIHADSGSTVASNTMWDDVLEWKIFSANALGEKQ